MLLAIFIDTLKNPAFVVCLNIKPITRLNTTFRFKLTYFNTCIKYMLSFLVYPLYNLIIIVKNYMMISKYFVNFHHFIVREIRLTICFNTL